MIEITAMCVLSACDVKLEWIKTEKDESENSDLVAAATEVYCDETAISEAWEEECKIEINDDFNDKYGGGEINDDDQLEGLFEDSTSREGFFFYANKIKLLYNFFPRY